MEQGKLDLMVVSEFRMSTSCVYADMVLPAAHWYEINDLSSTDMHPFIHPFTPAADPPWEARNNWEQFRTVAEVFSRLAEKHLGTRKDLVATPLLHDSPGEIAQPLGPGARLAHGRGGTRARQDHARPACGGAPLCRRAQDVHLPRPQHRRPEGMGVKGAKWSGAIEHDLLKARLGTVREEGVSKGMPRLDTDRAACDAILCLSPESNGTVSVRSWTSVEKRTGLSLKDISAPLRGHRPYF